MTPTTIRARLLTAQLAELRLIVTELKATRPDNMTDLANVCIEAQAEIRAAAVALQSQSVRDQTRFSLTS